MKIVKSDLRSTMEQHRLDAWMILAVHRERVAQIDMNKIADLFK